METYILRIYRRCKGIPHRLVGIVEESGVEGKKAFTCLGELWEILKQPDRSLTRKGTEKSSRELADRCRVFQNTSGTDAGHQVETGGGS